MAYRLRANVKTEIYQDKSNLSLYSLYYAKAYNEWAGFISVSLRPGKTAFSEEMLQRWQPVGNSVSDLTSPFRSGDERVTARQMAGISNRHQDNF